MPHGVQVPREVKRGFWEAVRAGRSAFEAAEGLGVSGTMGNLWLRQAGGMVERVKPPTGRRLSLEERETIALRLAEGLSQRAIAAEIKRDPSVVSREIRRNSTSRDGYRPTVAQLKAEKRARRPKVAKLAMDGPLREFVQEKLKEDWSPEQIANVLRVEHPEDPQLRVCAETIYQSLYLQAKGGLRRELCTHLRSQREVRKPRRCGEERRGRLPGTISISERPAEAADRAVPGHWEGDLIIGKNNGSAIGTLVERTSRFVLLIHLPGRRTAQEFHDALVPTIAALPEELRRSLTWDNGKEMAMHRQIAAAADIKIYFADPASPWQRGSNENTNGLLRQYFPKGISLRQFGPEDLAEVAAKLNNRPRKTLEWRTPAQTLNEILSRPFEPVLH
jgi:IS30 family transposase